MKSEEDKIPLYLRIAELVLDKVVDIVVRIDKKISPELYEKKPLTYKESQRLQRDELKRKRKENELKELERKRERIEYWKREMRPFYADREYLNTALDELDTEYNSKKNNK